MAAGDALVDAIDQLSVRPDEDASELELSTSDLQSIDTDEPSPAVLDTGNLLSVSPGDSTDTAGRVLPPPLPEVTARFLLRPLSENVSVNVLVPIGDEPVVVGRDGADFDFVADEFISPQHARFEVRDEALWVVDLESLNGIWIRLRGEALLATGDMVLIGRQVLEVDEFKERPNGDSPPGGTRRLGVPMADRRFRLLQIADDGLPMDVYHIAPDGCRVGRHIADLVFTDDNFMSGTHALFRPSADGLQLRDLSSRNGCWIRIPETRQLESGDAVMLGRTIWRISAPVD